MTVLDERADGRAPANAHGDGGPARPFARQLRMRLMHEHLQRPPGDDADLLDPAQTVRVLRESADRLDAWHGGGRQGPRPSGRLRRRTPTRQPLWLSVLAAPVYAMFYDPDGRPLSKRPARRY